MCLAKKTWNYIIVGLSCIARRKHSTDTSKRVGTIKMEAFENNKGNVRVVGPIDALLHNCTSKGRQNSLSVI